MKEKIFTPHELKTIEVDVEKKIFRINGEDFGGGFQEFTITCNPDEWNITMQMTQELIFSTYDNNGDIKEGHKKSQNQKVAADYIRQILHEELKKQREVGVNPFSIQGKE